MTIFILLGIGLAFLLITGLLILIDNKKRKYKKKMLPMQWRVLGIICTIISFTSFIMFAKYIVSFHGIECSERTILLRSTMELTDITLPTEDSKLEENLKKHYKEVIDDIKKGKSETTIKYVDALLNKKRVSLNEFHDVKYSSDLSKKQVQIVEYLVNTKDGRFTKPGVYYYIIFSEELNADEAVETTDENVKGKKEQKK